SPSPHPRPSPRRSPTPTPRPAPSRRALPSCLPIPSTARMTAGALLCVGFRSRSPPASSSASPGSTAMDRPSSPKSLPGSGALSGGNQQKLVAARELLGGRQPRVVVAVQPTRGLDLGATMRVHRALRAARDAGAAVLVVSLDLDELRTIADRILVLYDGDRAGA